MARAFTAGHGRVVTIPFTESLDERARAAAEALRRPLGASFDVTDSGAQWVYPSHVDDVQSGDEIVVFGLLKTAADPAPRFSGSTAQSASTQTLAAGTFAPLLEREAYRAYLDYLAEREANEPSEAVRKALATEQVKISVERRVVIPRTTMLVLETEWDYQRFGLERRALASILTIDAGGIGVMDRRNKDIIIPPPLPMPVPFPVPPPPRPIPENAPTAVDKSTANGVGGGAPVSASRVDFDAAWVGSEPRPAVAEEIHVQSMDRLETGVTAKAPAVASPQPVALAPPAQPAPIAPPPSPSPVPPPQPAEQAPVRAGSVSGRVRGRDGNWTKATPPTKSDIDELSATLADNPRDGNAYNRLSDAFAILGNWSALRRLALQWQPFDPENPQVYEILGMADEQLGNAAEAVRADASLIEIAPGKPELLQRAGLLLLRTHHAGLAEAPLRRALDLRPDRANSYRHLALMLWRDGRIEEAATVLESATRQQFPQWYGNVQRVIREELGYVYRAWLAKAPSRRAEIEQRARDYHVDLTRRDALRITLAWETDANDVDLHVVDPEGEECYYSHKKNASGLELYEDITQGLGPEVVRTDKLEKGRYHVGVNYFSAGPMGVSRGIVVIVRGDDVDIHPFRLVEGGSDIRYITSITVK
jgi:tetratricopeptide (TPR) repeat protein